MAGRRKIHGKKKMLRQTHASNPIDHHIYIYDAPIKLEKKSTHPKQAET